MRFALIGMDDLSRRLVHAMAHSAEHSLVAAWLTPDETQQLGGLNPGIAQPEDWESLLARRDVDAVIVAPGRDASLREEQLKRFVQDAITVVVVHPACDVMFAYELEMMRREAGGIIIPIALDWWHPGVTRLVDWLRLASDHGGVEQLTFQRSLADRNRDQVLKQFIRDAWPIRRLIGAIKIVSAAGATHEDASLANLSVHCSGENHISVSWSVVSPAMEATSRISIVCGDEIATLHIPSGDAPWTFEARGTESIKVHFDLWNPERQILDIVQRAKAGEPVAPTWSDACQGLEAADSVHKSLRRKRAVDLHTAEASEDQNFKGYMAAGGCLILMVILLAFLGLSVFEGFRMPLQESSLSRTGQPVQEKWPLWLRLWPVYPLVAFLLLQFLLLLAKRPAAKAATDESGNTSPSGSGGREPPGERELSSE
jgi:hypothetical protein